MKFSIFLILTISLHFTTASKILAVVPTPTRSHFVLIEKLAIELANKGHEVTLMSTFKQPKPIKNLKEVFIPNVTPEAIMRIFSEGKTDSMFDAKDENPLDFILLPEMGRKLGDLMFSQKEVVQFLKTEQEFDLIIGEIFLDESTLAGFSWKYKAPIIGVSTFMPIIWANFLVGNPAPLSYIPAEPSLKMTSKMTFWERLGNGLFGFLFELSYRHWHLAKQDQILKKYFGADAPPIEEILKNTSLVLVNHHYSLGFPRPYVPNMIEIGGYHVNPPNPLPQNMKKYLDESKEGVILLSMGSFLKSADFPEERRRVFINAFGRLKQNVVWKFEDDSLKNIPKNLKIWKWLPQSDLLAHPNVKLFITHGGLLSKTESVIRGVPMITIPMFADQHMNAKLSTESGYGIALNFDEITEETLYRAIIEVLDNPKYSIAVKKGSQTLQDAPKPAMETALYWIEYVIRHKGAAHLRSAAQDLKWHQLHLLDVIGVLILGITVIVLIIFKVSKLMIRFAISKFCKKTDKKPMKKNKSVKAE